jgi:hypothetical protein
MGNRLWSASISFGILTAVFLLVTSASGQSRSATKLSPVVMEYVKFDDGVIALTHVRVIDGTGQAARSDQTYSRWRGRRPWRRSIHADSGGREGSRSNLLNPA